NSSGSTIARYSDSAIMSSSGSTRFRLGSNTIMSSSGSTLYRLDQDIRSNLKGVVAWVVFFSGEW
ncbi:MAG: hypothetical protein DRO73_08765, partial [Candidatus Thorarchaeota archaeon]